VSVPVAELSGENCRLMYVQLSGGSDDSSGPTMNSYMYSVAAYRQLCRRLSQTCNCSAVPMTPVPNDAVASDINTVCSSKPASRSLSAAWHECRTLPPSPSPIMQCNEQCQVRAGEEDHTRPGWTTSRRGQDSPWKSQSE